MKISVYYDVVCPWCYIGHKRLMAALAQYPADKVTLDCRPFQLAPDMEREIPKEEYYRARGMDPKVMEQNQPKVAEIGRSVGINFQFERSRHIFNTLDAHRLVALAAPEKRPAVVEALYEGYFTQGLSYGRVEDLAQVAQRAGVTDAASAIKFLNSPELVDAVKEQVKQAYTLPIITVPYMVVNDRFNVQFTHMEGVAAFAISNLWE